jgi:hypothetical protein
MRAATVVSEAKSAGVASQDSSLIPTSKKAPRISESCAGQRILLRMSAVRPIETSDPTATNHPFGQFRTFCRRAAQMGKPEA